MRCALLLTALAAARANVDITLECGVRELAYQYAGFLLPWAPLDTVFDALRLGARCNQTMQSAGATLPATGSSTGGFASTYYVDPVSGNDGNSGSISSPFKTVNHAVAAARGGAGPAQIMLRGGMHYLTQTVLLTPADNGLSITGYPGEQATVSGGVPLTGLNWAPYKVGVEQPWNSYTDLAQDCPSLLPGQSNPGCGLTYAGTFPTVNGCIAACAAAGINAGASSCYSYTWHDANQGNWAQSCWLRNTIDLPADTAYAGHYSGSALNIYVADVSQVPGLPAVFNSLFNGSSNMRFVRARWPNGNEDAMLDTPAGTTGTWVSAAAWGPALYPTNPPPINVEISSPSRPFDPFFPTYQLGIGGTVSAFNPPESFWGSTNPPAGSQYNVPSGLVTNTMGPPRAANWSAVSSVNPPVVHAFHALYWGGWSFPVSSTAVQGDLATGSLHIAMNWTEGGWQEARGSSAGSTFYVENVLEELDAPGEWYFDAENKKLYMYFNSTADASGTVLVASSLESLFWLSGTQDAPVVNVSISNITLTHTATTFLKPYAVGSGGDFSYYRGGAVVLEGTEGATITGCTLQSIGNNAVALFDYNRDAAITYNQFAYIGDSAVLSVGSARGIDATDGNHPARTLIAHNLMRELAVWTKQSGAVYQAITEASTIVGNAAFNMARAGVNINDGAFGGHTLSHNLIFNSVRLTSDHGCYNSWDRQPYITNIVPNSGRNGTSMLPAQINVTRNYFINNYFSTWPIDTDDGSNSLYASYNFLPFGGGKNYLGFSKWFANNLYLYPDAPDIDLPHGVSKLKVAHDWRAGKYTAGRTGPGVIPPDVEAELRKLEALHFPYCYGSSGSSPFPSYLRDSWSNNTCYTGSSSDIYSINGCDPTQPANGVIPVFSGNTLFSDDGKYVLNCGSQSWSLAAAQASGVDVGTTIAQSPPNNTAILAAATAFVQQNLMTPMPA